MQTSPHESLIDRAADIVRKGAVVIVPTETFYGLAADPFQEDAVQKIFQLKGREENKPLPLIASDRAVVEELALAIPPLASVLMDRFWPGSLTLLFEPARNLSPLVRGTKGMVGIRVPPPCPARTLAALVGGFITATSANWAGDPNPQTVEMISRSLLDNVDLLVDLGPTPGGLPSTVVLAEEGGLTVFREGAISAAALGSYAEVRKG